jgi:addiction module RelE/StbE family toxin
MQVALSSSFNKRIKKIPKKIVDKFFERLELFKQDKFNPVLNSHKLHGEYEGSNSINITGDFRAVFECFDQDRVIFSDIGAHQELYE